MTDGQNYRSELENWLELWDQSVEQDVHPNPEPVKNYSQESGDGPQDTYYNFIDHQGEELLAEREVANPVYPDSVGPDHETTPPVWASEELMKEVEGLKNKLFNLENRLAKMGGDKEWSERAKTVDDKKLMSEIESLRKRLDKVSSSLGIEHESSPWVVKD